MKKLILGLSAVLMVLSGMVALGASPANANCSGYTCVDPKMSTVCPLIIDAGDRARCTLDVSNGLQQRSARASNIPGEFRFILKGLAGRAKGKYFYNEKPAGDGDKSFSTPKLKPGRYLIIGRFVSDKNSGIENGVDKSVLRVTR